MSCKWILWLFAPAGILCVGLLSDEAHDVQIFLVSDLDFILAVMAWLPFLSLLLFFYLDKLSGIAFYRVSWYIE